MTAEHNTVFISYRRSVSSFIARAVFLDLRAHGYDVFMDVESIDSGHMESFILNQIAARAHFVVILTPGTLDNCLHPGDWVRREIEHAIKLRRNIVPLLFNDFSFEAARPYLVGELASLPGYSGLPVPHEYFEEAMTRLRTRFLKQPVRAEITNTSPAEQTASDRKVNLVTSQPPPTEAELVSEQWFSRGLAAQERGDQLAAVAAYTEAIRLNPHFAAAYNNRGNAHRALGALAAAFADYTTALEMDNPELYLPYNNRGTIFHDMGQIEAALADYNESIRLNPAYPMSYYNRGNLRERQGDPEGALADLEEAIRLHPGYAEAYNTRANIRARQGDLDGALADYALSIELGNSEPHIPHFNRGIIYAQQGHLAEAEAAYSEAIRLEPAFAPAYVNRGIVRQTQGDLDGALADYEEYLRLGGGQTGDQAEVQASIEELRARLAAN